MKKRELSIMHTNSRTRELANDSIRVLLRKMPSTADVIASATEAFEEASVGPFALLITSKVTAGLPSIVAIFSSATLARR